VVLDAGAWEIAVQGLQVLVSCTGTAVQSEHLDGGVVADALGPDVKRTLGCLDRDDLDAAAQNIITARRIEVAAGSPPTGGRLQGCAGAQRRNQRKFTDDGSHR